MAFFKKLHLPLIKGIFVLILIYLCHGSLCFSESTSHNLMPVPAKIVLGEGKLNINSDFQVILKGYKEPRLERALNRLIHRLSAQTGIPLDPSNMGDPSQSHLEIFCEGSGEEIQSVQEDESYTLEINAEKARLIASTPIGVLHGIETFLQLVEPGREGFRIPVLKIQDKPRFPWRGLLIDICRHWMPMDVLKRNLDAMAAVKFNVLHWHLSEDQGFRIECKSFPKLHLMGSDGKYYTQEQVREVLRYARDLGIRIIPEFDIPGHTTSWFVGYPELASAQGPFQIERHWGIFDPCMDPTREEVYTFLDKFIGEMAALFPDEYFHIGGDEVNGKLWNTNPAIVAFKQKNSIKDNHELQAYFNKKIQSILSRYKKKMVGWDEIYHPDLPKNIVIQSWRGQESLAKTATDGYMGILSHGYYLDHMLSASQHYQVDPLGKEAALLNDEQKKRILGGEACQWAEFITPETIDSHIWPRAAAVAERLWSSDSVQDIEDMYRRLEALSQKLDWLDVTHHSNYPKMLKRLTGNRPIGPLKALTDIVEPVKYYARPSTREYTQMTPLNRLVDAARPESAKARIFRNFVDKMLADSPHYKVNREMIKEWLEGWRSNHIKLKPILEESFLLKEILPLSEYVSQLAQVGLDAIAYLDDRNPPPQFWLKDITPLLNPPKNPEYELVVMITPAIQKLVDFVLNKD